MSMKIPKYPVVKQDKFELYSGVIYTTSSFYISIGTSLGGSFITSTITDSSQPMNLSYEISLEKLS
jgi:hypothetical protein